jgi:hypothetical protein
MSKIEVDAIEPQSGTTLTIGASGDSVKWVIYRQALRDITEGLTTKEQVEAVVFPTKPE